MDSFSAILLLLSSPVRQEAPPPSPVVADCFVPGPWILFFAEDSTALSEEAKLILDRLIEKQRDTTCGGFYLTIKGHIDIHERADVARHRAQTVRGYLVKAGLDARNMKLKDMGTQEPRVANPKDVAEPQNRRVELHVAADE